MMTLFKSFWHIPNSEVQPCTEPLCPLKLSSAPIDLTGINVYRKRWFTVFHSGSRPRWPHKNLSAGLEGFKWRTPQTFRVRLAATIWSALWNEFRHSANRSGLSRVGASSCKQPRFRELNSICDGGSTLMNDPYSFTMNFWIADNLPSNIRVSLRVSKF